MQRKNGVKIILCEGQGHLFIIPNRNINKNNMLFVKKKKYFDLYNNYGVAKTLISMD